MPYSALGGSIRDIALKQSPDAFSVTDPCFANARIAFNDDARYRLRYRFSCAHEIGHLVLEHHPDECGIEDEADYFAGYLLAPHPIVLSIPEDSVASSLDISADCAAVAVSQSRKRRAEAGPWRPHERRLIENAVWKEGGHIAQR